MLYIDLSEHQRGLGFWRFNVSSSEDKEFVEQLNQAVDIELAQEYKDRKTGWENLKLTIRNFTLKFAARKKIKRE